ncbi:MAG: aldo/keto reductase [Anaerolineales bacterium]|nr:aldo/keto reductase [Anaerolineales bacterium]
MRKIRIGASDMEVFPLGIGAMAWGESKVWGYGADLGYAEVRELFAASIAGGVNFFDTAEVYGNGRSEQNVGRLLAETAAPVYVATKYAPLPWRWTKGTVSTALDRSLKRLGQESVDLYQLHFPFPFVPLKAQWHALADQVARGKVRYVGVSNYNADQMRRAYEVLDKRGVKLVSNQVEYSLVHRSPEVDGVLEACRELNVTLIAYSPLGRGLLSGKYKPGQKPTDVFRANGPFKEAHLRKVQPLLETLEQVGKAYGGKTPAQVALNWLLRQPNVLAIPGAKNLRHIQTSLDAVSWEMTAEEAAQIEAASSGYRQVEFYRPLGS